MNGIQGELPLEFALDASPHTGTRNAGLLNQLIINDQGRTCKRCNRFLAWNAFYNKQDGVRGKDSTCRDCWKEDHKRRQSGIFLTKKYRIDDKGRQCRKCLQYLTWDHFPAGSCKTYKKGNVCKTCNTRISNAWQKNNWKRVLAWRDNNGWKDYLREYEKQYRPRWAKTEQGKIVLHAKQLRRQARKRGAAGLQYTQRIHVRQRTEMFGWRCYVCGIAMEAIDHVKPLLSDKPQHWPSNLRPICQPCNSSKSNQNLYDWMKKKKIGSLYMFGPKVILP